MSKLLDLYNYWNSYKSGNANEELANKIKQDLSDHKLDTNTVLSFIFSIAHEGTYSLNSIDDAIAIYDNLDLENYEECGLSSGVLRTFLTTASSYNLDQVLVNAVTTWDIFKNVDDENPIKKAILNRTFDCIAIYGLYNNIEIISRYANYVNNHSGEEIGLPYTISSLISR